MKKILLILFMGMSILGYTQTTSKTDSTLKIEKDSTELIKLQTVGDETAKYLSARSVEEKEWFKKTFVRKRGTFTVPKEPITYPFKD
tara:strand:- start:107 stop:367 length:261 start_codon:yes stop_codon:yes gene_type:complete